MLNALKRCLTFLLLWLLYFKVNLLFVIKMEIKTGNKIMCSNLSKMNKAFECTSVMRSRTVILCPACCMKCK